MSYSRRPIFIIPAVVVFLLLPWFPWRIHAQTPAAPLAIQESGPNAGSCAAGLKFFDSPFFKICYPKQWHVIHGYDVNYAWWVFSKRKRGEQFDIPYIRIIISKGIAQSHLALQDDSTVLGERTYTRATNEFKEVTGKKLNGRYWREIAVGPEFDILAWYEQIKAKQREIFDQALNSFWVPPPPRAKPKEE
jgi:hypothetical protein